MMAKNGALFLLLLVMLQVVTKGGGNAVGAAGSSNIVELTYADLDDTLATGTWLLIFYAPWCGYCRRMEPVLDEVATELVQTETGVRVAKVDGSAQKGLAARFIVDGYPTIFHIHQGVLRKYKGDRSKDNLLQYTTREWQKQEAAFSRLFSPLSFLGRMLGHFLEFSVACQVQYETMRIFFEMSHPVALAIVALGTAVIGSVLGIIFSVIFTEKRPPSIKRE